MTHLSGGAVSGIIFGSMLFVFVSVSLLLWWRRVHKDHYSNDPNHWGGSWGAKAQAELQERIDKNNAERWAVQEAERDHMRAVELSQQEMMRDIEMQATLATNTQDVHTVSDVSQRGPTAQATGSTAEVVGKS